MPAASDTGVASRLHPGGQYAHLLRAPARGGSPLMVTAPTVLETVYGLARQLSVQSTAKADLAWYRRLFSGPLVRVLPFGGPASVLAGELCARHSLPPTGARRDERPKAERRVAWILDIQIAATAWTAGYGVATRNRRDFELLRDLIAELYPQTTPLEVLGPPEAEQPHR